MRKSNSGAILFGQIVNGVLGLLSVTLTAKYLDSALFGFCSVALAISIFFMTLADFGGCSWAAREFAANRISLSDFLHVMKKKSQLCFLYLLLVPILLVSLEPDLVYILILTFYPVLWNRYNFYQQYLLVTSQVTKSIYYSIIDRACWMAIIPLQIFSADKVLSFCLPLVTGLIAHNFLANKVLKRDCDSVTLQSKLSHRQIWKSSTKFGTISITSAFGNLDGLLVAIVSSASNSGSYILSQRFRNPLTIVFNSVSMRVRTIAAKGDFMKIKKALREDLKLLRLGAIVNIFVSIFLFGYADKIVGADFTDINIIVCLGTLSSIPLGVILISNAILSSIGEEVLVSRLSLLFLVLLFLSVTIFSIFNGAVGAVLGSLAVLTFQSLILAGILNTRLNPKPQ